MYPESQEVISNCRKLEQRGFERAGGATQSGAVPEAGQTISIYLKGNLAVPGDGKLDGVGPINYQLRAQVYTAYGHTYIHRVEKGVEGWTTISASPEHDKPLPIDQSPLEEVASQTKACANEESSKERQRAGIPDDITFNLTVPKPQFNGVEFGGADATKVYHRMKKYLMGLRK